MVRKPSSTKILSLAGVILNYRHHPFIGQADIVPLVPGYQPRADQNLKPVHAWKVDQRPRIYYYYSIYFFPHGSDYTYLGIIGYALPKFDPRGIPFHYSVRPGRPAIARGLRVQLPDALGRAELLLRAALRLPLLPAARTVVHRSL